MLKRTLTTLALTAVATAHVVMPEAAQARDCSRGDGYTICSQLVSQNGSYNSWNVSLQNAYATEYMHVICYGKSMDTWQSKGGLSQSEADYLARYFCSL